MLNQSLWLFWCIYFGYGRHTVNAGNNTDVAFKKCTPFFTCKIDDGVFWWSKSYLHCNDYVKYDWI